MQELVRQEPDRIDAGGVARVVLAALALGAAFTGLAAWLEGDRPPAPPPPSAQVGLARQTPILADTTAVDRRDAQERALHAWSWVDRDRSVAHVPVEVARELVLARGQR